MALKTTYKNDILDTDVNENRVFNIVDNEGNVIYEGVSFVDVSAYTQHGDSFSANDINSTNSAVNSANSSVSSLQTKVSGLKTWSENEFKHVVSKMYYNESGNTATRPYQVGDIFTNGHDLIEVTASIATGDTFRYPSPGGGGSITNPPNVKKVYPVLQPDVEFDLEDYPISNIQPKITKSGTYTGNIDNLKSYPDKEGMYFVNRSNASGTMPPGSFTYFNLLALGSIQIALPYITSSTSTMNAYYRSFINNAWTPWHELTSLTYIQNLINTAISSLSNYCVVESKSTSDLSISGGATVDDSVTGVATTKSGYTAIGVVGIDLNNASSGGVGVTNSRILAFGITSTGKAFAQIKNDSSGTIKIKIIYKVLYRKNI